MTFEFLRTWWIEKEAIWILWFLIVAIYMQLWISRLNWTWNLLPFFSTLQCFSLPHSSNKETKFFFWTFPIPFLGRSFLTKTFFGIFQGATSFLISPLTLLISHFGEEASFFASSTTRIAATIWPHSESGRPMTTASEIESRDIKAVSTSRAETVLVRRDWEKLERCVEKRKTYPLTFLSSTLDDVHTVSS